MRRISMLWPPLLLLLVTEVCECEEVGVSPEKEPDVSEYNTSLRVSRGQILTAQFDCYLKIIIDPPQADGGTYCNRTWDGWLCWGDSKPGPAMQPCPSYFHDFDPAEKVTKVCNADGQWFRHPESNRIWSNYTHCQIYTKDKLEVALRMYYLAIVGHGLSVISLLISLIIFSYFKSLSCQRISLHKNLFLSFILNSICIIVGLVAVVNNEKLVASNPISCKVLSILSIYTFGCNYFWMLCEGIYLHTLIIVAVFVGEQHIGWYHVLGWGFPLFLAVTYGAARWHFYNDNCWISSDSQLLYIVHGPIQVALIVNLFFLLNIMRVLITKLRVTHMAESNAYMKAVRGTLILVPLLGAPFILVPCRPEGRRAKAVYEFIMLIFSHFQGLLVAIIFCFCNGEVQLVLRRRWAQYRAQVTGRVVTADSQSNYPTNSVTETSRVTVSLELSLTKTDAILIRPVLHANGRSNGTHWVRSLPNDLETTVI